MYLVWKESCVKRECSKSSEHWARFSGSISRHFWSTKHILLICLSLVNQLVGAIPVPGEVLLVGFGGSVAAVRRCLNILVDWLQKKLDFGKIPPGDESSGHLEQRRINLAGKSNNLRMYGLRAYQSTWQYGIFGRGQSLQETEAVLLTFLLPGNPEPKHLLVYKNIFTNINVF